MFQRLVIAAAAGMLEARCGCYRAAASSSCKCAGTCHAVRPVEAWANAGGKANLKLRDLGYPLHSPAARILHTEIAGEGGKPGICLIDGYRVMRRRESIDCSPASLPRIGRSPALSCSREHRPHHRQTL